MPKGAFANSSRIIPDGALAALPGISGLSGDQPVFMLNSGLLDLVDAVTFQNGVYFPFAAKIVAIRSRVRVAPGTGAGTATVGIVSDTDKFGTQAHAIAAAAGTQYTWEILNSGLIVAGDVVGFAGDGGSTTNGSCDVAVFWIPRV